MTSHDTAAIAGASREQEASTALLIPLTAPKFRLLVGLLLPVLILSFDVLNDVGVALLF